MRNVFSKLVHGRDSSKAQNVEESHVDPRTMGGDPAPGYQWNMSIYYDGDLLIKLEEWTGKRWYTRQQSFIFSNKDFAAETPGVKKKLWETEQRRVRNANFARGLA